MGYTVYLRVLILLVSCISSLVSAQTNYNAGDHARSETVTPDGEVEGQYHYTGADGKLFRVRYTAGKNGFQVLEGDHVPMGQQQQFQGQAQQSQFFNNQPQSQQLFQNQQNLYNRQNLFQNHQQQQEQQSPNFFNSQQQLQNHQNFGQFPHPNALPVQMQPNFYQQPQQYQQQQFESGQVQGPTRVSVSQNPGSGFTYNINS